MQLLLLSAIWGSAFLAIDLSIANFPPFLVAFGRIFIATVFLLIVVFYKKLSFPRDRKSWVILVIAGALNNAVPFYLISWGQQYISSSTAAIMLSFGPFIALILSHFMTHDEKFSIFKLLGVFLGFLGVFILVGGEILSKDTNALMGQLAVLLATVGYISSGLLIRKLGNINTIVCSTSMLVTATLLMLPFVHFSLLMDEISMNISLISIIYLALIPTAIASLIRVKLVQKVGIQFMSQVSYLIPIFAIFWSWFFLSEIPTISAWIALCLILSGLLVRTTNIKKHI